MPCKPHTAAVQHTLASVTEERLCSVVVPSQRLYLDGLPVSLISAVTGRELMVVC